MAMFRNGKGRESDLFLLQLQSIFCEAASGLLLFQRIANFDFRLFTQVTHQSFKDDLCVVLGDTLHHRFF